MAKKEVNDEFYTPAQTIINELKYYGYDGFFKDKTIYLPCDYDATLPYIKKEVKKVTHIEGPMKIKFDDEYEIYKVVPELFTEKEKDNVPRKCQFVAYLTEHKDDFGIKDIYISGYDALTGKGMKFQDAPFDLFDVIITNPPFSQMKDWINKIVDFAKKGGEFVFLAPLSITTYTWAYPYFKDGTFWCGYTEPSRYENQEGELLSTYLPSVWLTNLEVKKHKPKRVLSKSWKNKPDEFMPYWNYKAINICSINDIPYDYKGVMGVPATFLKDIHPDQFEIVGFGVGKDQFIKLPGFIDKSNYSREDFKKYFENGSGDPDNQYSRRNGKVFTSLDGENPFKQPFAKMLIRNKVLIQENNYDYDDVIKWIESQLKTAKPMDIWNPIVFKEGSNRKIKHGKGIVDYND